MNKDMTHSMCYIVVCKVTDDEDSYVLATRTAWKHDEYEGAKEYASTLHPNRKPIVVLCASGLDFRYDAADRLEA